MIEKEEREYSRSLGYYAWQRMKKNRLAMFGLGVILLTALIALLGANIRPDATPDADAQKLELARKSPGFEVTMLRKCKNQDVRDLWFVELFLFGGQPAEYDYLPAYSYSIEGPNIIIEEYTGTNDKFPGNQIPMALADVLFPLDVNTRYHEDPVSQTVSFTTLDGEAMKLSYEELKVLAMDDNVYVKRYWLGTDGFGRDMLSRLMAGTLVSLSVGLISVLISLIIGISLGAIGGYFRGWIDDAIMWLINVVWSIPTLLLVIAITFALDKGFWQIFVAVGLTMWVEVARVVRGQIISLREQDFVEAGRALGFGNWRMIGRHILPNVMGPVIVISAANFAAAILIEAGLSFLGIGLQPPMPSWGRMIKDHYGYIMVDGAYLAILPGLCIMIMVLSFMLVGNGLRDALDTKSIGQS